MKILFTCVGRRVELIQAFKNAAAKLNYDLTIYGADNTETAPALYFCDKKLKICKIDSNEYIPSLIDISQRESIDALIPTIDTDLLLLSQHKFKFEELGTKVFISGETEIKICRDKRSTFKFFKSIGLESPAPSDNYKDYNGGFPAFIKPIDGSSSINAYKINNQDELETYGNRISNYIVAPFIDGTEYTVDVFCDYFGNPIYITPRIRLAVRSGEVLKTQITLDKKIIEETKTIIEAFKPCGAITIQLIRETKTNIDYFIEINPRFGGGAPLSIKAGADSAEALLKIIDNKQLKFVGNAAIDNAVFSRFDQSIRVK